MSNAVQFLKGNAVLLALVFIALYQQSEIKEMERTLNYIYAAVQANAADTEVVKEEVWGVTDLILAIHAEDELEECRSRWAAPVMNRSSWRCRSPGSAQNCRTRPHRPAPSPHPKCSSTRRLQALRQ